MRTRGPFAVRLLLALLCLALPLASQTATQTPASDPLARLNAAHDATNLTVKGLKPWHMLASFDLLDTKGKITEHGTFEEWWAAPDRWHQRITTPSFHQDSFKVEAQSFATTGSRVPYFLELLTQQLLDPIPAFSTAQPPTVTQQTKSFGPVQLECLLVQRSKQPAAPLFGVISTYCLAPGRPSLRVILESGIQQIVRNSPGLFQDKSVDLDLHIDEGGHPMLRAKIDQLQAREIDAADLTPPADMPATAVIPRVGSGVIAGQKISGAAPQYPASAKVSHTSGTVLLHAVINTSGHIESLETIWSPDPALTKASMDAVRDWTYHPYLLGGQPVDVETTITVNFNIGPSPTL